MYLTRHPLDCNMNQLSTHFILAIHLRAILVSSSNLHRLLQAHFLIHCEYISHLPYILIVSHPLHSLSFKHIGNIISHVQSVYYNQNNSRQCCCVVDTAAVTTTQTQHSHSINYGSLESVSFEVCIAISSDSYSARDQSMCE